ncbi:MULTISPECIES: hypothetical protein [Legionella]|uniref:Uncharacterized protein n=1 Tax=Legionella drozanskii LLAP-1 TaxID=1212489 RepID=A0A0W0SN78_9GAMM|nr:MULTISPECIES: hypothetical protein [Legionella]KTC84653.1 hypothetical protein Ldro_2817 [Legionella drozanskii LLAP-1]PJE07865.1 MAG: hypothetical protein CK430_13195 [Legionella sp.]
MKKLTFFFSVSFCFILFSSFTYSENNKPFSIKTYKFTFSKEDQFKVSFADYPNGEEDFYELQFVEEAPLPTEITTTSRSLKISGNNHSDDLFMYAYKKLDGLKANTNYQVHFSVEFASNGAADGIGTGGSDSSVYLKIGAVTEEPQRYLDEANFYRMVLDKGNQLADGKDMILLGSIGVDTQNSLYRLKTLANQSSNYRVTSNSKGELWLVLGTDSAFESKTTIYYTNMLATFKEITSD